MNFEVRGKLFSMEMPSNWIYYPEGLLVLPEESIVSFTGEVYDENRNPIDVIVKLSSFWGGYVVLFRDYAYEKDKTYRKFGVFTNEETAMYVARMVLLYNRAYQYNWVGLNQIILYGEKFDLDIVAAIAFLQMLSPRLAANEIIYNPKPNSGEVVMNPIVLVEHPHLEQAADDGSEAKRIVRKTISYTKLLMTQFNHRIPGISFFNEEAFINDVMELISQNETAKVDLGNGGAHANRWSWHEINTSHMIDTMADKLKSIYEDHNDGFVPTGYLETLVDRNTIVAPGRADPIK